MQSRPVLEWEVVEEPFDFFNIDSTQAAWQQWKIYSCVERHGDHLWMVELYHPEDCSDAYIYCDYCPAGMDEIFPDGIDLVCGQLDSINIEAGKHDSDDPRLPFSVPVVVDVEERKYFSPMDMIYPEYDVFITLHPRS